MPTLKRVDETADVPERLPVIALRDLVYFPYMVLPLLIGRPHSLAALEAAEKASGFVLVLAQRDAAIEEPTREDLYRVGTVVRLVQISRLPDGTARVVFEGVGRARVKRFLQSEHCFRASISSTAQAEVEGRAFEPTRHAALARKVQGLYREYVHLHEAVPDEIAGTVSGDGDRVRQAHLMTGHLLVPARDKQKVLEAPDPVEGYRILQGLLTRELEILRIEEKIEEQIGRQMDADRRQVYLHEQLRAIHKELGSEEGEWGELDRLLGEADLPPHARERAEKEAERLRKLNAVAPEAAVIRTYLDWILQLPWEHKTEERNDVAVARELLEEAHHGLDEVKERILDHIAVLSLVRETRGPILCLVGPPGVGKTSLGRSIAQALGREFVRASLGGVRDEAEIRGHRRTYVGAMPGRIIQGMRRVGSRNPVFLLDEIDKLAGDFHGDPAAALLEVLDPEQNRTFADHYLELEFDLSDVVFVTTANTLVGIPEPLRDRMEIIRLPGYLDTEKAVIARRFLWPRQAEQHGLAEGRFALDDDVLQHVIHRYTREAGVRELERRVSRIARKLARGVAEGEYADRERVTVQVSGLKALLGPPPYEGPSHETETDRTGIANGLAWTQVGGQVLDVEVAAIPGDGKIQLTGTLGDVMKESAAAAVTYARSRASRLGLQPSFHREVDIHIHIPEGATPKDGPSAGITIAVALISALTGSPTRADVAMTGEITLRGRVLPVGGVKEKAVAALRAGMSRMVLPEGNASDIELLPDEVRERLAFDLVRTMDEVLEATLVSDHSLAGSANAADAYSEIRDPGIQLSQ